MKPSSIRFFLPAFLAACGGVMILAATGWAWDWPRATKAAAQTAASVAVDRTPLERQTRLTTSYAPIVKKVAPSVVNIFTTKTVRLEPQLRPFFNDPFFRRFFGDPDDQGSFRRVPPSQKERSLGSGVIVSDDGYILTNNHVVDGADEIRVAMANHDKKDYAAKIVGRDPRTDIAILKIEASNLQAITFTDSDQLQVGDMVLAVGNPFNLGQTVTMGMVSAINRGNIGIEDYENFIQTDAAINPGNSGGALVDTEGRLVGINTAILSRTGGNQGIGFAVPANLAHDVMERILKDGRVVRGYLGVVIQDLNSELAQAFDLKETQGALISDVSKDGAAAKAGLQSGDVVVAVDGKPVVDSRQLKLDVARHAPGDRIPITVLRQGKEKTFEVTLKEFPDQLASNTGTAKDASSDDALNGVTVADLDTATRRQMDVPANINGALVIEVEPDSTSAKAGLREGDVILEINRKPVHNANEAVEASKNIKNKQILLRVWSRGGSHYLVVDESKKG